MKPPSTREQLEVALAAQRPLEVDLLVSESARRTIDEIDEFLEELRAEKYEREGSR